MASYLFNAADEDMARWKAAAKARGIGFADLIRISLAGETTRPGAKPYVPPAQAQGQPRPRTGMCAHRLPPETFCSRCDA